MNKNKIPALFKVFIIILFFIGTSSSQVKRGCLYKVDTLLLIKYGDSSNMISRYQRNPRLFCVNDEYTCAFQSDGKILMFDNKGVFKGKKRIPLKNPNYLTEIIPYKAGFVLLDFSKMYYVNTSFTLVDSADYLPDCVVSNQFNICEDIYFNNTKDCHKIIKYNIDKKKFSIKPYYSIWNAKSVGCTIMPFTDINLHGYEFCGASTKVVIADIYTAKDKLGVKFTLFNTRKCIATDLIDFRYFVNVTSCPWNMFKFINDSTAVFSVRYFDTLTRYSGPIICPEIDPLVLPGPEKIERDCVFYKITFSGI